VKPIGVMMIVLSLFAIGTHLAKQTILSAALLVGLVFGKPASTHACLLAWLADRDPHAIAYSCSMQSAASCDLSLTRSRAHTPGALAMDTREDTMLR
jgi:hypothetical protein